MHVARSTRQFLTRAATAALLAAGAVGVSLATAQPAHAATVCDQFGTVVAGNYIIMNNRWGTSATQCISTTSNGFSITQQDGTGNLSGAPVSYPAIYLGCHYGNCSPNSPLPAQISSFSTANSTISDTYPGGGTWDAAYDIWLNADTNVTGVQDTEIMIWLNHQGSIQPIGSPTGSASLAGHSWTVWTGNNGQNNVVSYVASSAISSLSFNVRDFITDTLGRGSQYGTTSWYLTSIQAGFEPWIGGVGLAVNSFSASIGGGGGGTQPPGAPGTPSASNVTASAATLNWATSSGTVTSYQIERATGATSTSFTQVGTSTTTSFTNSGLSAGATYRYRVRASNSAGSSGYSGIVNVTTPTSGGGGGGGGGTAGCTYHFDQWATGYVAYVTVNGPTSGWSIPFTLGSGNTITSSWNATLTVSGTSGTATNASYNGTVAAGQSTQWGFQGTRPSGGPLPSFPGCTAA
jgi:hypothetical protein